MKKTVEPSLIHSSTLERKRMGDGWVSETRGHQEPGVLSRCMGSVQRSAPACASASQYSTLGW